MREGEKRKKKKGEKQGKLSRSSKGRVYKEFGAKRKAGVDRGEKHAWKHQDLQLKWSYTGWLYLRIILYVALDG